VSARVDGRHLAAGNAAFCVVVETRALQGARGREPIEEGAGLALGDADGSEDDGERFTSRSARVLDDGGRR
jgi:hypothetical protein